MNIYQLVALVGILFMGAVTMSFIRGRETQKNKIKELELKKEILELENEKENVKLKLLEEENKKYDRIINEER